MLGIVRFKGQHHTSLAWLTRWAAYQRLLHVLEVDCGSASCVHSESPILRQSSWQHAIDTNASKAYRGLKSNGNAESANICVKPRNMISD